MSVAQSTLPTCTTSTRSTSSEGISYTPCDGSICSLPPRVSASREPGDTVSSASDLNDPILEHFASQKDSAAPTTLPIRQITPPGSPSSSAQGTGSNKTDSDTTGLNFEQDWVLGTPATSDASDDAGTDIGLDQDHEDPAAGIANRESSLFGLELPREFQGKPLFCDVNDGNNTDNHEIPTEFLHEHINSQARSDARPWTLVAEDFRWLKSDGVALAPRPGPGYSEYYLTIRNYSRRYHKIQQKQRRANWRGCKTQRTYLGFGDEPATDIPDCQQDISRYVFAQYSSTDIEPRSKRFKTCHDVRRMPRTHQQQNITRSVDCVTFSVENLVSIFHPSFLVSHLSRSSVSTLTTELYSPNDFVHNSEYSVGFTLGFGPLINLDVCTFTPREKTALRSYQKHEGKDELNVQESLPIAMNLFSVESHAEELDTWLDGIIDSDSGLPEYVNLMMLRQKEDHCSQLLKALIAWYMTSKYELLKSAHQILRPALKLLITTTLLSLVPKVTDLPDSLLNYLSSQSSAQPSTIAPRLLTRQIKASLYHLQQQFLNALFCHFTYPMALNADVEIVVALLVAYVLDMVRKDGRQFAKYLSTFNATLVVTNQDVADYEANAKSALFDRVRASVSGAVRKTGVLVESLRSLDSIGKGKEKQSEEYQFVCAILDTVLE